MAGQRDHDLRLDVDALASTWQAASKIARTCMRVSSGIRMMPRRTPRRPEHRVRLAQRFDPLQEVLLRLSDLVAGRRRSRSSGGHACSRILRSASVLEQFVVGGQELVQRRVEQPDDDRQAVHGAEQAGEVAALQRQQLVERVADARSRSRRP